MLFKTWSIKTIKDLKTKPKIWGRKLYIYTPIILVKYSMELMIEKGEEKSFNNPQPQT